MAWILKLVENTVWNERTNSRELYETQCGSCHKTDMTGSPPGFPSLLNMSEAYDEEGFIEFTVAGAGRMPAFSYLSKRNSKGSLVMSFTLKKRKWTAEGTFVLLMSWDTSLPAMKNSSIRMVTPP